jgi:hypothetical protein
MNFFFHFILELEQDLIETTKVLTIMHSCIEILEETFNMRGHA